MGTRRVISVVVFLLCGLSLKVAGQDMTTMGTDFWFSFAEGRIEAEMCVTVTGTRACTGLLTNPNTGWTRTFNVPAGGSVTVVIDTLQAYNTEPGIVRNKGLHLTTTDEVSVYASNFLRTSFDATFVMPTGALGDEYMVQTFESCHTGDPSEFLIVGVEDNTVVDIFLPTSPSAETVTLMAGQCYMMQNPLDMDFSGTRIKSRDCKRIAVFNGHLCAHIPKQTGTCCDHLFEQSVPVKYWGREFVATMASNHNGDYVKVTSMYDNCTVWVDGSPLAVLQSGESCNFSMTNYQHSRYIKTSKPAVVYTYMMSKNVAGPNGDPSMVLIPPIEQRLMDVTFVNYNNATQLTSAHFVNVVASTADVADIYLDDNSLGVFFNVVSGNAEYSYARVPVGTGTHRLRSEGNDGFVAYAYGVGGNESYGYAVGFSTRPLNGRIYVNDVLMGYADTMYVCVGDSVWVCALFSDTVEKEGWNRDGVLFSTNDTVMITSDVADTMAMSLVYSSIFECTTTDTLMAYVVFREKALYEFDSLACGSELQWNGVTCDSSGVYQSHFAGANGCDSTVTMHLSVNGDSYSYIEYGGCDSVEINGVAYYSDDTVGVATYTNHIGCDSVVYACLKVHPSYLNDIYVNIDAGDTLVWIDGGRYYDDSVRPIFVYQTVYGCDSVLRLNLHLADPPALPVADSSAIWIPNAFMPNESSNNIFKVFGSDLKEVHVWIYNRWGNYVTDFDGLSSGWDGRCNGKECKEDAYVYLIEYKTNASPGILQKKIGTVLLLK